MKKLKTKKFCGEKIEYEDGIGCCIWNFFEEDDSAGLAFDFNFEDIDELIDLLKQMKITKPIKYGEVVK